MNEQFCDVGRGITLCYEQFGDPAKPTALLIMGLGTQMIGWPDDFCRQLADRGFHVLRFDNRDAGRWPHFGFRPPTPREVLTRRPRAQEYALADMADDAAGLIRALDLAPAHLVGASMGGMIAQTLAAREPELVGSLASIMSSTGSRTRGQPALALYRFLLKRAPEEREAFVAYIERVFEAIGSPGFERDREALREMAELSFERDPDRSASGRQLGAILKSGNRTKLLRRIRVPTVVIHGTADKLVRPSGGRATARAIPGAHLVRIEGMGHDLPRGAWSQIIDAIVWNAGRADRSAPAARAVAAPSAS